MSGKPPPPPLEPRPAPLPHAGSWEIGEVHHKLRLDRALKVLLGGASEKFIDRAFRAGCVSHNGRVMRADQVKDVYVKRGDKVTLRQIEAHAFIELSDTEWKSRILFEDTLIMVVDKPAGLSSAPAPSEPYHAVSALEGFILRRDGNAVTLRNVHRLDKLTSGVLLMAKNAPVAAILGAQFKSNLVQKTYWAVLDGVLEGPDSGMWSDRLEVDSNNSSRILPPDSDKEGKSAKARFEVLERSSTATVVELRPSTGRMHQLRVQTAYRHAPIAGDDRYGRPGERSGPGRAPRLCLHCQSLTFSHPADPERKLEMRAPIPGELTAFARRLAGPTAGSNAADASSGEARKRPAATAARSAGQPAAQPAVRSSGSGEAEGRKAAAQREESSWRPRKAPSAASES